jgi:hypothetical protein
MNTITQWNSCIKILMLITGKTWLHWCDAALPGTTNRKVMGLYKYDDINQLWWRFLCNIEFLLLRNHDCWDFLDLQLLQCRQCTKTFWRKISCNIVEPRTKVFVPSESPLQNQCHKHTGFNKKICTNLFPTCMPQTHIIFKKQGMEKVPNGWRREAKYIDNRIILKLNLRYL